MCVPNGPFVSPYFLQDPFLGGNCLCADSTSEMVFPCSATCGYLCGELKFQVVGGEAAQPIGRGIDLLRSFASRSPLFRSATRPVKYILGGMSPLWLRFPFTPWLEQSEDNYFTCACGVQGSGGWSCQKTVKSRPSCDCT